MRFYRLIAAFATVLISHNVKAEESHKSAVSFMKSSISGTLESLKEYRSRRKLSIFRNREVSPIVIAKASIQREIANDFEVAETHGKIVESCRRTFNLALKFVLLQYRSEIRRCLRENGSNCLRDSEISILLWAGKELEKEVEKFPQECDSFMSKKDCLWTLESNVGHWELTIKKMIGNESRATVEEAKRLWKCCMSPALIALERELKSLETITRECLAALPVKELRTTNSESSQENLSESSRK